MKELMNYLKMLNCPIYNKLNKRNKLFLYTYIMEAKTQSEAYKIAYKRDDIDSTCYVNACKLLAKTNIQQAHDELIAVYTDVSEEEIKQRIKNLTLNSKNESTAMRGLELLGKVKGMFNDVTTQTAIFNNIEPAGVIEALSHKRQAKVLDVKNSGIQANVEIIESDDTTI